MTKVAGWLHDVAVLEQQVQRLKERIAEADEPAREAYNDSLGDQENRFIRAWGELTEKERNVWRAKIAS